MSGDMNVAPRGLQAPHFDHNGVGTRSHRFAVWESALSSYLGAMHGQLGPVALLRPVKDATFYGLRARIKLATNVNGVKCPKNLHKWVQLQYLLGYIIQQNFSKTDKSILDTHNFEKVRERHVEEFSETRSYARSLKWLPHATILFHQVKDQYFDDDGTEALVKILWHEQLKHKLLDVKKLSAFMDWNSKFTDSWNQVNALVCKHSPSYLAGLQLLQVVRQHPNQDIQNFANLFMQRNRDGPFNIEVLLEDLKVQFRSNSADRLQARFSATAAAAAPAAADTGNQSQVLFAGTAKKKCVNFDSCGKYTNAQRFDKCKDCWQIAKAEKTTGLTHDASKKMLTNMKKKFQKQFARQKKEYKQALAAIGAEKDAGADAALSSDDGLDIDSGTSDDDNAHGAKSAAPASAKASGSLKSAARKRAIANVADASLRDGNALSALGSLSLDSSIDHTEFVDGKSQKKKKRVKPSTDGDQAKKKKKTGNCESL
jgi:hypothetical protein